MKKEIFIIPEMGITFYPKWKIKSGYLDGDQTIQDIDFKDKTQIRLYENGKIELGNLNGDQTIQGINVKHDTWIKLYENGKIESGNLKRQSNNTRYRF